MNSQKNIKCPYFLPFSDYINKRPQYFDMYPKISGVCLMTIKSSIERSNKYTNVVYITGYYCHNYQGCYPTIELSNKLRIML